MRSQLEKKCRELEHRVQTQITELEECNRRLQAEILERNKSEAALRESENKFRQLFQNANDAIYLWELGESGDIVRCLEVNDVACRLLGYSREELLKMTPHDLDSEASVRNISGLLRQLSRDGRISFEAGHLTRDGAVIPMEIHSQLFELGPKKVILSIARDITEHKRTEEMLKRQNAYLTALHETAIGLISRNDRDSLLVDIVERACRLVGTEEGYIYLCDPETDELVVQVGTGYYGSMAGFRLKLGEGLAGKVLLEDRLIKVRNYSDWQKRHRDGRLDNIGATLAAPLKFADRTMGVIGLSMLDMDKTFDLEAESILSRFAELASIAIHNAHLMAELREELIERSQTEKALKESHETLLTVLDSIDATIYVADMDTYRILFMNQFMKDEFSGNFEGRRCWAVFRCGSGPCGHCSNKQLLDGNGEPTGVHVWEGQNPITKRWYLNHDRAIKWPGGRYVRMQIATDISRIKELETERRESETRLRQSHKMEAIGTLAGGIAHDFNNILSAIIGYTELSLIEVDRGSILNANLEEVIKAGKRARDLVSQILMFSRQGEYRHGPIQLGSIVKEALKLMRATLPSTIEIRQHIQDGLDPVLADATQIHQILMNLCANAAHAMRKDGGILEVNLEKIHIDTAMANRYADLETGSHIRLRIEDSGTGIPTDIIDSIFDPYFTTKQPGEGTGLGLSVVHGIVKSYGGDIRVKSQLDAGTVFDMVLPATNDNSFTTEAVSAPPPTGNEHILLIDDEPALVEIGKKLLVSLGYKVVTQTNSHAALELFNSQPWAFDLVVSDMTMPGMTGEKLAQEMIEVRPDIPVILCTGYSQQISEQQAYALGIRAFLYKPISIDILARTVRTVLEGLKN